MKIRGIIMATPTKFQKIDSYMSALCIGAAATVSFWLLFIGLVLGIVSGPQKKASFSPLPYAQNKAYDTGAFPGFPARQASLVVDTGIRLS